MHFTEESNALDYFERAAKFIREAPTNNQVWKWVVIALHGALYGFAICACKGTNYHNVTTKTKWGPRLISFSKALALCEDPEWMQMTVLSKPLVLTDDQRTAITHLQLTLRNPFEHYIPLSWHAELHGMPNIAIHCIEVICFLAIETRNYTRLVDDQRERIASLATEAIAFLSAMPLHIEHTAT